MTCPHALALVLPARLSESIFALLRISPALPLLLCTACCNITGKAAPEARSAEEHALLLRRGRRGGVRKAYAQVWDSAQARGGEADKGGCWE